MKKKVKLNQIKASSSKSTQAKALGKGSKKSLKSNVIELDQANPDELYVRHFQGNVLRFSIKEFVIISDLRCTSNEDNFCYPDDQPSRLIEKYFPDAYNDVNKARFFQR